MGPYKSREEIIYYTYEHKVRRQAARLGLKLTRSRARLLNVNDLGEYRITDPETKEVVAGAKFDLDINQAKAWLDQYEAEILAERQ
jgi:hypothetical protein